MNTHTVVYFASVPRLLKTTVSSCLKKLLRKMKLFVSCFQGFMSSVGTEEAESNRQRREVTYNTLLVLIFSWDLCTRIKYRMTRVTETLSLYVQEKQVHWNMVKDMTVSINLIFSSRVVCTDDSAATHIHLMVRNVPAANRILQQPYCSLPIVFSNLLNSILV